MSGTSEKLEVFRFQMLEGFAYHCTGTPSVVRFLTITRPSNNTENCLKHLQERLMAFFKIKDEVGGSVTFDGDIAELFVPYDRVEHHSEWIPGREGCKE